MTPAPGISPEALDRFFERQRQAGRAGAFSVLASCPGCGTPLIPLDSAGDIVDCLGSGDLKGAADIARCFKVGLLGTFIPEGADLADLPDNRITFYPVCRRCTPFVSLPKFASRITKNLVRGRRFGKVIKVETT